MVFSRVQKDDICYIKFQPELNRLSPSNKVRATFAAGSRFEYLIEHNDDNEMKALFSRHLVRVKAGIPEGYCKGGRGLEP